jgi:glycerol-3-phosphate dehydrogenase
VVEGRRLWDQEAAALHVPVRRIGALVLALSDADAGALAGLRDTGIRNGVADLRLLTRQEALNLEPLVSRAVRAALLVPREAITDPFAAVIALAEHAATNGVTFHLGTRIESIDREGGAYRLKAGDREVRARWLINAAGLFAADVARLAGRDGLRITPRKGEFLIFDKQARNLVSHILLPVPTKFSKGILVAPTVFGNVLAGPTAIDQESRNDRGVTPDGLARVRQAAFRLVPDLQAQTAIASYAGLRAVGSTADYQVDVDARERMVTISGIRSTGLSSALALAQHVVSMMQEAGLGARSTPRPLADRPKPLWVAGAVRPCHDPEAVARNPALGHVVCLCEQVSFGEVTGALHAPVPATSLDAVKKRTWATAGRCQGYFCTAALIELMARELSIPLWHVTKRGPGSELLAGPLPGKGGGHAAGDV